MHNEQLPYVRGGYTERRYSVEGYVLSLNIPRDPDQLLDDDNVIQESEKSGVMPYWAHMWPAAEPSARFILRQNWSKDEPIHEIGCGLGLTGMVMVKAGFDIVFSDHSRDAMELVRLNLEKNHLTTGKTEILDWRIPPTEPKYSIIIGCDILYETQNHAPILETLRSMLKPGGVAYIFDPGRNLTRDFCILARETGWELTASDEYGESWSHSVHPGVYQVLKLQLI
jgi:predicted nicotinamide N-methyase